MKYLKITNTPEGLRVARALIGSLDKSKWQFIGISSCEYEPFITSQYDTNPIERVILEDETLRLPLEDLKLCPYIAMREGLATKYNSDITDNAFDFKWSTQLMKVFDHYSESITLDIEWACSLDGIEVVDEN